MHRLAWVCVAGVAAGGCRAEDAAPEEERKLEPDRPVPRPLDEQAQHHQARLAAEQPPPDAAVPPVEVPATLLRCFAPPLWFDVPRRPDSMTVGDFTGDGHGDVLLGWPDGDEQNLQLYRGAGDGSLVASSTYRVRTSLGSSVAAGDLDGDGDLDLAINDVEGKRVHLAANAGDGTFRARPSLTARGKVERVSLVQLDADAKLDLHVELAEGVELFGGTGSFKLTRRAALKLPRAEGLVAGDFDGDRRVDLAYVSNDENVFFTLRGERGGFKRAARIPSCDEPGFVTGGDLDDDGDLDAAYFCRDTVELQLNTGTGEFVTLALPYGGGRFAPPIATDLTGDGKTDLLLAVTAGAGSRLVLLAAEGTARWTEHATLAMPEIHDVAVVDLDGDGTRDLVVTTTKELQKTELMVLLARGCP